MRLEFRTYHRQLKQGLRTSQGQWQFRAGVLLRLSDAAGRVGFGEIAPLSWFGSESLEQALDFCRSLPTEITAETIFSIPVSLPACQFGFESAWEAMTDSKLGKSIQAANRETVLLYSGLLPSGNAALQKWQALWSQGYRTFKWKIGVVPLADEIQIFHDLVQALPSTATLRLDANGRLNWQSAVAWLRACDQSKAQTKAKIEFLEQPLPIDQVESMRQLSRRYATPLALDESVATLDQLEAQYRLGWQGIFAIKPAIAGSPSRLRQFCQQHPIDVVFSSVFETGIGRQQALKLAAQLAPNRAVGFGIDHWFEAESDDICNPEQLWQSL